MPHLLFPFLFSRLLCDGVCLQQVRQPCGRVTGLSRSEETGQAAQCSGPRGSRGPALAPFSPSPFPAFREDRFLAFLDDFPPVRASPKSRGNALARDLCVDDCAVFMWCPASRAQPLLPPLVASEYSDLGMYRGLPPGPAVGLSPHLVGFHLGLLGPSFSVSDSVSLPGRAKLGTKRLVARDPGRPTGPCCFGGPGRRCGKACAPCSPGRGR